MIKEATMENLAEITSLALLLWPNHTKTNLSAEISELINRSDAKFFLVFSQNVPIGFAQCQLRYDYVEGTSSSPVGYLEALFVKKEFRKKGIAKRLVKACETWAKEKGCQEFASDCELKNVDSFNVHLRLGFEEANRIICFIKKL